MFCHLETCVILEPLTLPCVTFVLNNQTLFTANGEATEAAATEEGGGKKSKSGAKLSEGEEEDDEDDNIDVVIGDIRTTPNYNANLHIKRQNLLTLTKVRPPI